MRASWPLAAIGLALGAVVSCALAERDVGSSSAQVTVTLENGGPIDPIEQEPSAVVVVGDATTGLSCIVVGYNDESASSPMGWALTCDGGMTWAKCSANAPCNGPGGVDTSQVQDFKSFLRHPSLATDGNGNVVYVTLADTNNDPSNAERVVAVLSTDGGSTFKTAFPVNQDGCNDGEQDMPHATFDYSTVPPTLWIVWRHNGSGGSFGGCIRRFFVDTSSQTLVPLDDPRDVENMDREGNGFGSQGGLMVQAGDGVVTVAYANSDENDACPTGEHHGRAWATVSSVNDAHDFAASSRIFHSDDWHSCLSQPANRTVQNSIRDFDFVRTPTGIEYAVLADTPESVRFFMNPAAGVQGYRDITSSLNAWREWCPGTALSTASNGPTSNWRRFEDGPCPTPLSSTGPPFHFHTMLPTIASDGNDRVVIGLFSFAPTGTSQGPTVTVKANVNPLLPGSPFVTPAGRVDFTPSLPSNVTVSQKTDVQPFGAYFCMLAKEPTGALVTPGCSDDGDFFPFWVRASAAGTPQIATRGVQVQ